MPCLSVLSGVDLIEEHLHEIRTLRQRLEDSIRTNERLRQQLETRLAKAARDGGERSRRALFKDLCLKIENLSQNYFKILSSTVLTIKDKWS